MNHDSQRGRVAPVNSEVEKVYYGLIRATSQQHSVVVVPAQDWARLLRPDGSVTELAERPEVLSNPVLTAAEIVSIASGICNASPGMMIARLDPKDAPTVINVDQYTAIEKLPEHPIYPTALARANVTDSLELRQALTQHIFVVKERPDPQMHWVAEFPEIFLAGRRKDQSAEPNR